MPESTADNTTTGTVRFLGTGTSVGVPMLGCDCAVCHSENPRNNRTRCAILFELPAGNLLVDTPPDIRAQLLRERIDLVHAVLYTHEHADHLFGLDDLRLFPFRLGKPVPLYCEPVVESRIRKSYDYAFADVEQTHPGSRPRLDFESIDRDQSFEVLGVQVMPIPMRHGPHFEVLGFRVGDFAYCTDTNFIPDSSLERLQGLDTFVVGALRRKQHPTHFNLQEALAISERVGARQTYFTHVSHDLEYAATNLELPTGVELAYDGLQVKLKVSET